VLSGNESRNFGIPGEVKSSMGEVEGQGWRAVGFLGPPRALPCTSAISPQSHTSGRRIFGKSMLRRAWMVRFAVANTIHAVQ